jgi:hypothetical protein
MATVYAIRMKWEVARMKQHQTLMVRQQTMMGLAIMLHSVVPMSLRVTTTLQQQTMMEIALTQRLSQWTAMATAS